MNSVAMLAIIGLGAYLLLQHTSAQAAASGTPTASGATSATTSTTAPASTAGTAAPQPVVSGTQTSTVPAQSPAAVSTVPSTTQAATVPVTSTATAPVTVHPVVTLPPVVVLPPIVVAPQTTPISSAPSVAASVPIAQGATAGSVPARLDGWVWYQQTLNPNLSDQLPPAAWTGILHAVLLDAPIPDPQTLNFLFGSQVTNPMSAAQYWNIVGPWSAQQANSGMSGLGKAGWAA